MDNQPDPAAPGPPMTSTRAFLTDPANLITQAGLVLGTVAIYAALCKEYNVSILFLLAAFAADYIDGPVARGTHRRSEMAGALGGILDSISDVVCHSVAPAIILLCYGDLAPRYLPVAAFFVLAGALRMARNTVEGGISSTFYRGLSSDNNIVILAMAFLLEPMLSTETFASLLAVILVVTGGLNLSTVPVPRIRGRAYYAVAVWTIGTVAVFANRLGET